MRIIRLGVKFLLAILLLCFAIKVSADVSLQNTQYFPIVINVIPTATPTPLPPPNPRVPPPWSTSYYMKTISSTTLYNLGCIHGTRDRNLPGVQDSVVVLDFGKTKQIGAEYGVKLFGSVTYATSAQIGESVKHFGRGYVECSGSDMNSHVRIGIGTNNYNVESSVTYEHGQAWARMVNDVNNWFIAAGYFSRVDAVGASDMELGWNSAAVTRRWVDGYDSSNQYALYNFGDAASCPAESYPYLTCASGWTQDDVWYISYGVGSAFPLPLIYADNGINAEQWYLLSVYAYTHHGKAFDIKGAFTEWQACQQAGGCGSLDNTPEEGWLFLWDHLNGDPRTKQILRWSTDIKW